MNPSTYWRDAPGPPRHGARLLGPLGKAVMRSAWNLRVHGHELVPETGPVILASNHTGFLDGPLLYATMRRPVYALVKMEMFHGVVGRALTALGQISVDRFQVDLAAVRSSLAVLERGDLLGIYPEGTRGAGDFSEIKPGLAYLGLCTGAPIVPVACLGVRAAGRSTGSLPPLRERLDVVLGEPIRLPLTPWPRRQDTVREHTLQLRDTLVEHVRRACELTGRVLPGSVHSGKEQASEH
jgi:1-acyl-sn-glycerol-3-phosphate acyltransferase